MKIYCGYFQRFYIAALCLPLSVFSTQSQTVSLIGKVIDVSTHQPVRDAVVVMLELGQRKNTNDDGRFFFGHLAPGRYTISVHHVAYAGVERMSSAMKDKAIVVLLNSSRLFFNPTKWSFEVLAHPRPRKAYHILSTSRQVISLSNNRACRCPMR